MSNLHGILNNLVNELTESNWVISPEDAAIAAAREARKQQEEAQNKAAEEALNQAKATNDAFVQAAQPSLYDRFGQEATDLYNAAKDEVAAHPWIYGGLGAAALASGAGALALRKRLAKTKNQ